MRINQQTAKLMVWVAVGMAGFAQAGSLTPPGAPGPTMNTMAELYQKLTNALAEVQSARQDVLENQQKLADLEQRLTTAGMLQSAPGGMVLVPAGSFVMGATTNVGHESETFEVPQHTVTVSAFYMDKCEVASNLWRDVYVWASNRGYAFANAGACKGVGHPVQTVSWHDCVAWCNARSQQDGFTVCYTNANGTAYTNSSVAFVGGCNWSAEGYRLPTESEWEKAARGGTADRRFAWNDANTIQHARANYCSVVSGGVPSYDTSPTSVYHPSYNTGGTPYTSPVGVFAPNGYGLYDMAGNVSEWCWDSLWIYTSSPSTDPRGGTIITQNHEVRGGNWSSYAQYVRVAYRNNFTPSESKNYLGFRTVRKAQ